MSNELTQKMVETYYGTESPKYKDRMKNALRYLRDNISDEMIVDALFALINENNQGYSDDTHQWRLPKEDEPREESGVCELCGAHKNSGGCAPCLPGGKRIIQAALDAVIGGE